MQEPASQESVRRLPLELLAALLLVLLVALLQGTNPLDSSTFEPNFYDDAYITFRYAHNLSQGQGFIYNPGEAVLGTTTPLFTLLLAGAGRLAGVGAIPTAALLITLLADGLNLWLMYRLAYWLTGNRYVGVTAALVFLLQPLRLAAAAGGMETSLFIAFLLLMYHSYLVRRRCMLTALWAALAFLVRPDALIAILPMFIDWVLHERKRALQAGVLALLLVLPWLAWSTAAFGSPLPNSIVAKAAADPPLGYTAYLLITFLFAGTPLMGLAPVAFFLGVGVLAVLVMLFFKGIGKQEPSFWVMAVYPLLYILIMIAVNAPVYFSWYYLPLMPALILLLLSSVFVLLKDKPLYKWLALTLECGFLLITPLVALKIIPNWSLDRTREASFLAATNAVHDQVKPGQVVLAPDIGIIGWQLDRAVIFDSVGLVSPQANQYGNVISQQLISDVHPALIISLDQFIDEDLRTSPFFVNAYEEYWSQQVTISDDTQWIRVYKSRSE
jgi:arabinofuranosyltransferase